MAPGGSADLDGVREAALRDPANWYGEDENGLYVEPRNHGNVRHFRVFAVGIETRVTRPAYAT